MVVDSGPEAATALPAARTVSGLRAGTTVLLGIAALNLGNYAFHVIAARHLGPSRYSDLATLIAISGLISLPLGGVQIWVARHVAQYRAGPDDDAIRWFARRVAFNLVIVGIIATALFLLAALPLRHALGIASLAAVGLTALTVFPSVVTPGPWGVAQGLERFGVVALGYAVGPVTRLLFVIVAFAVGAQVGGAMLATLASMIAALAVPSIAIRPWYAKPLDASRRIPRGEAFRSLFPVMIGLLAITALTSEDVVVAKLALSSHDAGIYGSASLVGRVILYFPSAIVTVLLPRVAARVADRQETSDLLARSIGATLVFCLLGTIAYAVMGGFITQLAFGSKYSDAGGLLWMFGIAMTGFAILNVLLIYHLAREQNRMSWLLFVGALVQTLIFVFAHGSPRELILVDTVIAFALIVLHEALLGAALTRSIATTLARRRAA